MYQGRFKSFPVQDDGHLFTVCKYVVRNPVRAGLVDRPEKWRWSSLWKRKFGDIEAKKVLADGPFDRPEEWYEDLNRIESEPELASLRKSVNRGKSFGSEGWLARIANEFGMGSTLRPRGRPQKTLESLKNKGS